MSKIYLITAWRGCQAYQDYDERTLFAYRDVLAAADKFGELKMETCIFLKKISEFEHNDEIVELHKNLNDKNVKDEEWSQMYDKHSWFWNNFFAENTPQFVKKFGASLGKNMDFHFSFTINEIELQ